MRRLLMVAVVMLPLSGCSQESLWQRTAGSGCLVWDELPQPKETVSWSRPCVDGKASGRGTEVFRYRDRGAWKEERYVGEMRNGKLHGRGTLFYDNGDLYEGDYVNGKRASRGTYTYANGDRYEGEFTADKITGHGIFTYRSGGRYEGQFVDGKFQGTGIFTFANGDRYEGEFKRGMPNGHGTFKENAGATVTGNWSNGCFREGDRVAAVGVTRETCGFK